MSDTDETYTDPICSICKPDYIEDYYECKNEDCFACEIGRCFKKYLVATFCSKDCTPKEVLEEQEQRRQEKLAMDIYYEKRERPRRERDLKAALARFYLPIRKDSKLCKKYIDGRLDQTDWTLAKIVNRMAEMHYLYNYCNMKQHLADAEDEYNATLKAGYFLFQDVNGGDYPAIWPWLSKNHNKHRVVHKQRLNECLEIIRLMPGGSDYEKLQRRFNDMKMI